MSTGKRIAKRSILGTRVCAVQVDGLYHSGVIQASKSSKNPSKGNIYTVSFDNNKKCAEFHEFDIVGPGFQSVSRTKLKPNQKVYLTYNGREVTGEVVYHRPQIDEVLIKLTAGMEENQDIRTTRKIEDVRLLECRKCARLQGQDTDFAKLADVGLMITENRKRPTSHTIDIDISSNQNWSRKRRPSSPDVPDVDSLDTMNDCTAALVLMSLSCSPKSPRLPSYPPYSDSGYQNWNGPHSWTSSSSGASSWDSAPDKSPNSHADNRSTPSPPSPSIERLSESAPLVEGMFLDSPDEGIEADQETRSNQISGNTKTVFKCTWPGCQQVYSMCQSMECHVREKHLGKDVNDGEEEFYYTEVEMSIEALTESFPNLCASSPPTLSHMDMARPPYEDPVYQKSLLTKNSSQPISIPQKTGIFNQSIPVKHGKSKSYSHLMASPKSSPHKVARGRSESRKCRKVYGMENRDLWCTQCKWKKACSRFTE